MPSHHGYQKVATNATLDNSNSNSSPPSQMPIMESSRVSEGLPSTHSSQQLMPSDSETASIENRNRNEHDNSTLGSISYRDWCTVIVLCFINLINYMDRFTIAGKFRT